ncbi:MAG: aminotransferase [Phycisphaeraceae bacterium]|nr:MAG: aminotransferase [Phycisphaeraceae bacterium]
MSELHLSNRVSSLKPSVTVAFTNRAKALRASGEDVLIFAAGEPDFDTPEPIKDAAIKAMKAGETKYKPTLGDMPTRDAIAKKLTEENGIGLSVEGGLTGEHVAIGAGGKHVLFSAIHALFDPPAPGEPAQELLLPTPSWVSYRPIAELAGGVVREIPAGVENDFKITADQLRDAITPNSRMLVLNSPSNPCGTMYSEAELRAIAAVVAEAAASTAPGLLILTDEIYEKIAYGGIPHFSIGAVPEVAERTITLNGLSKAYAMTGWRIGYGAMPGAFGKKLIKALGTLQGQMTTCITSFNYAAIREALTNPAVRDDVARMNDAFATRAQLMEKRLAEIPGVKCPKPTGAFYVFPDISGLFGKTSPGGARIASAADLAEALLGEAKVAFVPGEDFGGCGGNHVRISFACSEETINEGMDRFAGFVAGMK